MHYVLSANNDNDNRLEITLKENELNDESTKHDVLATLSP